MSDTPMTEEFFNPSTDGENDEWVSVDDYNSLLDSHAKLEREFNCALLDAVRYRWLRHDNGEDKPFVGRYNGQSFSRWTYEHADSAIDAAMRHTPNCNHQWSVGPHLEPMRCMKCGAQASPADEGVSNDVYLRGEDWQ